MFFLSGKGIKGWKEKGMRVGQQGKGALCLFPWQDAKPTLIFSARLRAEKARTGGKETQYGYHMGPVPTIGPSVVWVEQGVLWVKYINFKKGLNGTLDRVNLLGLMEFFTFFVFTQFFKVNKRKAMNVM